MEGTEKVRFLSIPLISVPSGRFPRARLQPIELRRVRLAVFLCSLQKLRHSCPVLPTLALLLAKAVLSNGSSCGVFSQGRVNFLFLSAVPAGVAALHYNQLVLTKKRTYSVASFRCTVTLKRLGNWQVHGRDYSSRFCGRRH